MNEKLRTTLLFLLAFIANAVVAQNVSTQPQKCNVLIEDFTGMKCGNCPDAHIILKKLQLAQPGKIFPIAIHAGGYATPTALDQPNFLTEQGTEIHDHFGIYSYPSGMVNRRKFDSEGLVQSRSLWTAECRQITAGDADVNVWVGSSYDKDTRVLSADVELYYINKVEDNASALCVSLLQSNILGPQAGGNMEDEYEHNHVLRAMLTPTWGDTIATSVSGTLVKKHYEYVVPEIIGNIETAPLDFDIVAYVINTKKEVMNVNGCRVKAEGLTRSTTAELQNSRFTYHETATKSKAMRNYGYNFFECRLRNKGTEPLTSAEFKFILDDEDEVVCSWTAGDGEAIPGLETADIRFPVQFPAEYVKAGCDYTLQLTGINGKSVKGNKLKGTFAGMINVASDLSATITNDDFAGDNTYRLLDADGNVVAEYGPYKDGAQGTYTETIHFPSNGVYCFEIFDAWGNGILSPRGSLKIYDATGKLLVQNNEISDFGYRVFFNYTVADGIAPIEQSNNTVSASYNLLGQRVATNAKGIKIRNGKAFLN